MWVSGQEDRIPGVSQGGKGKHWAAEEEVQVADRRVNGHRRARNDQRVQKSELSIEIPIKGMVLRENYMPGHVHSLQPRDIPGQWCYVAMREHAEFFYKVKKF